MEKISVVVPVYKTEKYISNFIKSIIYQTHKNFELILVNDGTPDNSIKLAEELLKDTNVEYVVINKENGGQSTARNAGIKNATGKYLVLFDSDDAIQKDYLETMYNAIKASEAQVAICDLQYVKDENIFEETKRTGKNKVKSGKEFFEDFIMHRITIGPYSLMIEKDLIDKLNLTFNEQSRYSEEFIFITKLLYNTNIAIHVQEKLYNYCLRQGSVSTGANIDKIVNGFREIEKASMDYVDEKCKSDRVYNKFAHARWMLATARFTAANMKYEDYKKLLSKLNAKIYIKTLYKFPSLKIILAAMLFCISLKTFYLIAK